MRFSKLEAFIFEKMAATRLPGLSIALVKGDKVVYKRGFGLANIAKGTAATPETIYGAASITKSFVAIAILQLAERKLLRLTDPVDRFIKYPVAAPHGPVRIRHLLSHTSGMPALAYIEALLRHAHQIGGRWLPIGRPRDVLTFMEGADGWNECPPGERWFYLNEGYVMLGEIIAKITGQPYEQYVKEQILTPLGMSRSFFAEEDLNRDGQLALPYVLPQDAEARPGKYLYNVLGGDGALFTNVLDLARYISMFLRRGRGILSEKSFGELIRPRIAMPSEPISGLLSGTSTAIAPKYAFGLCVIDDFFGEPMIGHGGSLVISTGQFAFLPHSNVGVAVLANANGYAMGCLAQVALAMMLGRDPESLPFMRVDRALSRLTGHYETYRGTLRVKVARAASFLRIEWLCGPQSPAPTILVPESLDGPEPRFFTCADAMRLPAVFRHTRDGVELIYERYKFRRTGPLT